MVAVTVAGMVLLAGCGGEESPTRSTSPEPEASVTSAPATTPDSTSETGTDATSASDEPTGTDATEPDDACSTFTGEEAAERWVDRLDPVGDPSDPGWQWDAESADTDGYDPCADLSWISISIKGATGSSPRAIMLFHRGDYLGTATDDSVQAPHTVKRLDDATLEVTYRYPKDGEGTATASGEAVSTFTWDPEAEEVVHAGEFPPGPDDEASGAAPAPGAYPGAGGGIPADAVPMQVSTDGSGSSVLMTPSGNIGCQFSADGFGGCGVLSWLETDKFGPAGPGGPLWWVELGDGSSKPHLTAMGAAPYYMIPPPPTVDYGTVVHSGDWVCASEEAGLTCWHAETGHGAFINADGYAEF